MDARILSRHRASGQRMKRGIPLPRRRQTPREELESWTPRSPAWNTNHGSEFETRRPCPLLWLNLIITTVMPRYGHQQGARIGCNPHRRPKGGSLPDFS